MGANGSRTAGTELPLIRGEFGAGAYGPTIRLLVRSPVGVVWLREVFLSLANAQIGTTRNLESLPEVSMPSVGRLELVVASRTPRPRLTAEEYGFTWIADNQDWLSAALLLDPFSSGQAGHQYFTDESVDAALIEVSFGEDER